MNSLILILIIFFLLLLNFKEKFDIRNYDLSN